MSVRSRRPFTAAGNWGDGILTVVAGTIILLGLVWPLGVWHGHDRQGNFTWNTTSLIAEGCWLAFLLVIWILGTAERRP
jgi:fumarate reductase subunit D